MIGGEFAKLDAVMVQPANAAADSVIESTLRMREHYAQMAADAAAAAEQTRNEFIAMGGTLEEVSAKSVKALDDIGASATSNGGIISQILGSITGGKGLGGLLETITGGASSGGIGGIIKGIGGSVLGKLGLGALGGPAGIVGSLAASVIAPVVGKVAGKVVDGVKNVGKKIGKFFGFASGGSHSGGLRLVGERGPELEVTGPSKIFSAEQTRRMLSSTAPSGMRPEARTPAGSIEIRVGDIYVDARGNEGDPNAIGAAVMRGTLEAVDRALGGRVRRSERLAGEIAI
jgi:hypothetical protein